MSIPERVPGSKRHSRNVSYNRAPLARRMTKGPLDVDDPLAPDDAQPSDPVAEAAIKTPIPSTPFSPEPPSTKPVPSPTPPPPSKDFAYLLRPEIYHPLSNHPQPDITTPLPTLLTTNHYSSAAILAAHQLTTPPPPSPSTVFSLLYTRLACLVLTSRLALAATEAACFGDINSPLYRDDRTGDSVLPWELRVLVVQLGAWGSDTSTGRSVGGYYDLAREARRAARAATGEERKMWTRRLRELGLCVASVLVERGELAGAVRCLRSQQGEGHSAGRMALCYLQVGDVGAARRCLEASSLGGNGDGDAVLPPLLTMAEGRYEDAIAELRALPQSDLIVQNLAVCLFYVGRVEETMALLGDLVEKGRACRAVTFNLATCYELTTERARLRKGELAERVGGTEERGGGVFKL